MMLFGGYGKKQIALFFVLSVMLLVMSGCEGLGQTPPPPPHSVESLGTAIALTENAPPPGFEAMALPLIDAGLSELPGYRYMLEMRFEGVLEDSQEAANGHIRAEAWWDGIAPARRVVLDAGGGVFSAEERGLEAVRLIDDYYLVDEEGQCLSNVDQTARVVANLEAGALIGGITETPYSGVQAVLNGFQAYRYNVNTENAILPLIVREDDSTVEVNGEIWVASQSEAVVRYYANVDVASVRLFEDGPLVSGQMFIRYDAFDLGEVPNISIPFGC